MKVLLVEDSLTLRMLISDFIVREGHEVITANDGEDGIRQFLSNAPDLILLDVQLPKVDGYEVARRIRALDAEHWIPIIFLSAMVRDEDVAMGIDAGGDDYITKPVSQAILAAKLRAMQRIANMRRRLLQTSKELEAANRELALHSQTDGLTGIANRRQFDHVFEHEWRRCVREHAPISLLLIDVDCFKQFNDHYGHVKGDQCLRDIAQMLHQNLPRPADLVARYGGEEFAVVLCRSDASSALRFADALRIKIEHLGIAHDYSVAAKWVTVSIGCATIVPEVTDMPSGLIEHADTALYRAKDSGRNRAVQAEWQSA